MIRGGKSLVSTAPAFSNDAKKLLVCTGTFVSVFSTSTALQITSLEGHDAPVTSVVVVPSSSNVICYCWTASLDGTIRYWDFSLSELMKTINVRYPIYSMVIPALLGEPSDSSDAQSDLIAYLSVEDLKAPSDNPKALHGHIRKCNLTKSRLSGVTLSETRRPEFITVSPSGKFFGIQNRHKLKIWSVPDKDSERSTVKKIILHHTKCFTALAFHPNERIVAGGDATGRILIWRGFGDKTLFPQERLMNRQSMDVDDDRPGVRVDDDADSCSTWHWHSMEVMVLCFNSDGAYLYSGGREGVFVVWQLDTGKKKFLPRIGSPLLYFKDSPDPALSAISCADNQIHLLKMPSMEISKSISGIKLPCSLPEKFEGFTRGLAFNQAAGLVALHTENYCIQLYSLFDDHEVSEVQVCERNHRPSDDITVAVTLVALSLDGSIMSTVEAKLPEEGIGGLSCLKFWALGSQNRECSLSTIIYEPHRDAVISSIAFHPIRPMAVSSSCGGDFKIWVRNHEVQLEEQNLQNSGWTCYAVGSYKKKPMTAAAFSADGSVLAVAAETFITLWDPDKNVLIAVAGETLSPIMTLLFVGEYLVSTSRCSKPQLSVWSLSKLSMHWSYKLHVEAVACALDASLFAVLALLPKTSKCLESNEASFQGRDGVILLFNARDPIPVASWSVRKAYGGGLAFLKGNSSCGGGNFASEKTILELLVYMNGDHEYVIFDPYDMVSDQLIVARQEGLPAAHDRVQYGYASIYGELPEFESKSNQDSTLPYVPAERPWENIFSGSSHNLPPLSKLCAAFLESFLEKQTAMVE